jgi:hypothetical protein
MIASSSSSLESMSSSCSSCQEDEEEGTGCCVAINPLLLLLGFLLAKLPLLVDALAGAMVEDGRKKKPRCTMKGKILKFEEAMKNGDETGQN